MRRANGRRPSAGQRATAYSDEQRETLRRGLRILARMIARAPRAALRVPVRGCVLSDCAGRGRGCWRCPVGI